MGYINHSFTYLGNRYIYTRLTLARDTWAVNSDSQQCLLRFHNDTGRWGGGSPTTKIVYSRGAMPKVIIPILTANSTHKRTKEQRKESRKGKARNRSKPFFRQEGRGALSSRLRRLAGTLAGRHSTVSRYSLYRRGIWWAVVRRRGGEGGWGSAGCVAARRSPTMTGYAGLGQGTAISINQYRCCHTGGPGPPLTVHLPCLSFVPFFFLWYKQPGAVFLCMVPAV